MQEGLKHFSEIPLTVVGMLLFFVTFITVLTVTVFGKKTKERMDRLAGLPLREDDQS
jgi:cbb3-type cytochrome oxidase subunit 3